MEDIDKLIKEYQESLGQVIARREELQAKLPKKDPWEREPALWRRFMILSREEGDLRWSLCQMLRWKEGNVRT